jgi:hypothetical protein
MNNKYQGHVHLLSNAVQEIAAQGGELEEARWRWRSTAADVVDLFRGLCDEIFYSV